MRNMAASGIKLSNMAIAFCESNKQPNDHLKDFGKVAKEGRTHLEDIVSKSAAATHICPLPDPVCTNGRSALGPLD